MKSSPTTNPKTLAMRLIKQHPTIMFDRTQQSNIVRSRDGKTTYIVGLSGNLKRVR